MRLPALPLHVTRAGWTVGAIAAGSWGAGALLGWTELVVLGASSAVLVLVGLVSILAPRPATASVQARPARTTVGMTTQVELTVRAGAVPLVAPLVRLQGEVGARELRARTLWPGRQRSETFELEALRRGVFTLGPVEHVQSDLLGLFRRTRTWGSTATLRVRPRVLVPSAFSFGGVFDLEGLPSDQLSMSDLAFHTLREYVPGDDLRRVHWPSSAKADTLLVRQYVESRSLHAAVLVVDDPAAYAAPEELETAISVAASLGLRALADGFELDVACGDRVSRPASGEQLLDETCTWGLATPGAEVSTTARVRDLARRASAVGAGIVVAGSSCDLELLMEAAAAFGGDAQRLVVRVRPDAEPSVGRTHGVHVVELDTLDRLPRLAAWVRA